MKTAALILVLGSSFSLLTLLTAEEVPEQIVQRAQAFVLDKVGGTVYQEYIEFVDAKVVEPSSTCLEPDSKCDPEFTKPLPDFDRVDAVAAERIAREYRLAAGVKYWEVDFAWYSITRTYVWLVTTTTEQRKGYAEGETLLIDANSGKVIDIYNWVRHSCGG